MTSATMLRSIVENPGKSCALTARSLAASSFAPVDRWTTPPFFLVHHEASGLAANDPDRPNSLRSPDFWTLSPISPQIAVPHTEMMSFLLR